MRDPRSGTVNERRPETISDYDGGNDTHLGTSGRPSEVDKSSGTSRAFLTGVLLVAYGALSVVLVVSAFFSQIEFEGCGYLGSSRQCNYALGTGALYGLVAAAILLFTAAVSLVVRARGAGKPSWPIPIVGSAASLLASVVYFLVMDIATH